jgi:hypothetical protein
MGRYAAGNPPIGKQQKGITMAKADDTTTSTDVSRIDSDIDAAIASLNDGNGGGYSSIKGNDFASRIEVAKALTSSEKIDDHKGETLALANIIIQTVEIQDSVTKETVKAPRVTLVAADGKAYHATSTGLLGSVKTILGVLGEPHTWPAPVNVKIVEQRTARGFKVFTIEFV